VESEVRWDGVSEAKRLKTLGDENTRLKRLWRESFRPFAPSILEEAVGDWFEEEDAVPFMTQVFQIKREKRPRIPAVTHVDGSGRLQSVSKKPMDAFMR
jgi:predicted NodU family carbamoyl transferase